MKRSFLEATKKFTIRIFYDLETSGNGCERFKQDRILEIAAVAEWAPVQTSEVTSRTKTCAASFSELVKGGAITQRTTAIHGLTAADIELASSFEEVWDRFVRWVHEMSACYSDTTTLSLVGHGSFNFDNYRLLAELARCNRDISELLSGNQRLVFEDTLPKKDEGKRCLKAALNISSLKNSDIFQNIYGVTASSLHQVHHALWDATATRDNWLDQRVRQVTLRMSLAQQVGAWKQLLLKNENELLLPDISDSEL
jgi:DNA polymerase III epsilon subunit-like protein